MKNSGPQFNPEGPEGAVPFAKKKESAESRLPRPIEYSKDGKKLYIIDLELDVPECAPEFEQYVPSLEDEKLKWLCMDKRTLELLYKVAEAYKLKESCLMEGEPSTSKTSAVEYLAALLHQPFLRMNYSGQTDTSELIGKFVPNDGELQITFEQLLSRPDLLSPDSKKILAGREPGAGLTQIETQKIAQFEGLKIPEYRWQDGRLVFAATKGFILLNDELGYAEPQILGRGMSALEKHPRIEVTENEGLVIRELNEEELEEYKNGALSGVVPLHENFRQFGATNPPETHGGRVAFEPAYKDRWLAYKFVHPPIADEYTEMMELLVYGEHPIVEFHGAKYQQDSVDPLYPLLAKVPNFRGFLAKLAKFQETLEDLARRREIGKNKKDKYVFTRRALIEFLAYCEAKSIVDRKTGQKLHISDFPEAVLERAIEYYYLDKLSDPDDIKKIKDQLGAIGIYGTWTHKFKSETTPPPLAGIKKPPTGGAGFPTTKPPEATPMRFTSVNGVPVIRDSRDVLEDLRVGDQLKVRRNVDVVIEVANAKKLIIAGFTANDKVIVQIDGNFVVSDSVNQIRKLFEKESQSQAPPINPPKTFIGLDSKLIELSPIKADSGFTVGQQLVLSQRGTLVYKNKEILESKSSRIVGFTPNLSLIIQLDSGRCLVESLKFAKNNFIRL